MFSWDIDTDGLVGYPTLSQLLEYCSSERTREFRKLVSKTGFHSKLDLAKSSECYHLARKNFFFFSSCFSR